MRLEVGHILGGRREGRRAWKVGGQEGNALGDETDMYMGRV